MITNDELKRIASGEARFFPSTGRDMATELLTLREQNRWRKYPDEKPEYITCRVINDGLELTATFDHIGRDRWILTIPGTPLLFQPELKSVSYWQPLPSAPDAKGGE